MSIQRNMQAALDEHVEELLEKGSNGDGVALNELAKMVGLSRDQYFEAWPTTDKRGFIATARKGFAWTQPDGTKKQVCSGDVVTWHFGLPATFTMLTVTDDGTDVKVEAESAPVSRLGHSGELSVNGARKALREFDREMLRQAQDAAVRHALPTGSISWEMVSEGKQAPGTWCAKLGHQVIYAHALDALQRETRDALVRAVEPRAPRLGPTEAYLMMTQEHMDQLCEPLARYNELDAIVKKANAASERAPIKLFRELIRLEDHFGKTPELFFHTGDMHYAAVGEPDEDTWSEMRDAAIADQPVLDTELKRRAWQGCVDGTFGLPEGISEMACATGEPSS